MLLLRSPCPEPHVDLVHSVSQFPLPSLAPFSNIMAATALLVGALGLHGTWLRTSRRPAARAQPAVCRDDEPIVVIGSGIGGLSCACMLARYGRSGALTAN